MSEPTVRPSSQELADRVREAIAIAWPEGDHAEPNLFTHALEALDVLAARALLAEDGAARYAPCPCGCGVTSLLSDENGAT